MICDRYRQEFPDEEQRHGEAGMAWCRHDNQHILAWGTAATYGFVDLWEKVEWLAGVLEARGFPLARLARNLEIAAEVVSDAQPGGDGLARDLVAVAERVRGLPSDPSQ